MPSAFTIFRLITNWNSLAAQPQGPPAWHPSRSCRRIRHRAAMRPPAIAQSWMHLLVPRSAINESPHLRSAHLNAQVPPYRRSMLQVPLWNDPRVEADGLSSTEHRPKLASVREPPGGGYRRRAGDRAHPSDSMTALERIERRRRLAARARAETLAKDRVPELCKAHWCYLVQEFNLSHCAAFDYC